MTLALGSTLAAVAAGVALITWRLVDEWRENRARVAYRTSDGVTVLRSESGFAPDRMTVEAAIEDAALFWRPYFFYLLTEDSKLDRALARLRIGFTDNYRVTYAGREINARGATSSSGTAVVVSLAHGDATTRALITHEVGHVCLFALGVPGERHHDVMAEAKFPY